MQRQSKTLSDKIVGILNTIPTSFDPDDDSDLTKAQILEEPEAAESVEEDEEVGLSNFRRANIDLLADVDEKYAGKKTSRKQLSGYDSQDSSKNYENDDGNAASDLESSKSDTEDNSESADANTSDEDEASIADSDPGEEADDSTFKHFNAANISNQMKKGVCVRNQMAIWENLLEIRIQLQKSLLASNQMPQKHNFSSLMNTENKDFKDKVNETKKNISNVFEKLVTLQQLLVSQFPETKSLCSGSKTKVTDSEEEIPSDTDVENEDEEVNQQPVKKKMKLVDYESEASKFHDCYKKYRNTVIQKWNNKTRVVLKGDVSSHSVLDQIEYSLKNKENLVKKLQQKKSDYSIIGEEGESNAGIFDDTDFYHQLLRELIEVKSADVTDPVQLGRQWIELQSLRNKLKRKIDTKATKGRKIRYAIHSKLVNFMGPYQEGTWTDEARDELYNSLFGKRCSN